MDSRNHPQREPRPEGDSDLKYLFTNLRHNTRNNQYSERDVVMVLGLAAVVLGAVAAMSAGNFPPHRARLERWGGALLLSGVALIALAFPIV